MISEPVAGHVYSGVSAWGLWTAFLPVLSLLTSSCGSSFDAATVRPASSVLVVIVFVTAPCTVLPCEDQVTRSPFFGALMDRRYPPADRSAPASWGPAVAPGYPEGDADVAADADADPGGGLDAEVFGAGEVVCAARRAA